MMYFIIFLSVLILISGCNTQNKPITTKDKAGAKQDSSVLLLQINQLENELTSANNQIKQLQHKLTREENVYFLRNQLDIMAHTMFSAIMFNELDRVTDYLSEKTSIEENELITKKPDNKTMIYDITWIKNLHSDLDYIRQRAYYLSDDDSSFTAIYEFIPRPVEHGEFQIGVLHIEFVKENSEWKIYHLYNDI